LSDRRIPHPSAVLHFTLEFTEPDVIERIMAKEQKS
jgi:hypothetical protein